MNNPPDGTPRVLPMLTYADAPAAIDFLCRAFGFGTRFRLDMPDGRVGHAELRLGPVTFMIADEFPEYGLRSPQTVGGTGTTLHLHVDDVDRLARRAVEAGATLVRPPTDEAHGERQCRIRDPFGHEWLLGHPVEEVSVDEMRRRIHGDTQRG
jgi:uncharacterized glyoxalase superfamily protein PhnB